MANPEKVYVRTGGATWASDPKNAAEVVKDGGSVIGQEEAVKASSALDDLSYVDNNWGVAGKLGQGLVSGLSLGLVPGFGDPNHIQAAQASPWYTAGDVAGTVLPALLSGGESSFLRMTPAGMLNSFGNGTERLVGSMLAENTGLLGKLAVTPAKMAARGMVDGAALSLGHTVGQGFLTNTPLSAESMLASGMDGALMGGLIGGSIGTVGSLGGLAIDGLGKAAKNVAGRSGARDGLWAKRVNLGAEEAREAMGSAEGMGGLARRMQEGLEKGGTGAKISSSDGLLQKGFTAGKDVYTTELNTAVQTLDREANHLLPSLVRTNARLDELAASRLGTAEYDSFSKNIQDIKGKLEGGTGKTLAAETPEMTLAEWKAKNPDQFGKAARSEMTEADFTSPKTGNTDQEVLGRYEDYKSTFRDKAVRVPGEIKTWEQWSKTRDFLAKEAANGTVNKEAMGIIDSSIREAMEAAETIPGLEGISSTYTSARAGAALMAKLEESLGEKAVQKLRATNPGITAGDLGRAAMFGAVLGSPVSAAGWLAQKGLGRSITERFEPALAQMAFDMSVGQKAATATSQVRSRISTSLKAFFSTPAKAYQTRSAETRSRADKNEKLTRERYEQLASKAEQLVSNNHQDRVNQYAQQLTQQGYQELAQSIMETNARAVNYALYNLPARQGAKGLGSLRKMPASHVPTLQEYGFTKKMKGLTEPLSVLDDLQNGTLSRDQVHAMKYVYPEVHAELVQAAGTEIYNTKLAGNFLPMSKISGLGILLDAPVDSTLMHDYISAVQTALSIPPAEQQAPPGQATSGPSQMSQDLMTPLQKVRTV